MVTHPPSSMRQSLFKRVAYDGVLPMAVMLLLYIGNLLWREQALVQEQRNHQLTSLTTQRLVSLGNLLGSVSQSARQTAELGTLQPDMPRSDYWGWLAALLDADANIYGAGITFLPANRGNQRKDLYVLRGAFGNHKDERYHYQDESYTYDGSDGSHEWFSLPQKLGTPVWSQPYFDEGSGNVWMISYSVPFYRRDNQAFDGVAFTDLKLDSLQAALQKSGADGGAYFLLNAQQQFVTHSNPELAGKPASAWGAESLLREVIGEASVGSGNIRKLANWPGVGPSWYYTVRVPGTHWLLVSAIPDHSLVWGMEPDQLWRALSLVVALGLALAAALLMARRYIRPLTALTKAVSAVARGEPNAPLVHQSNDELGELADAVRTMRDHLAARDQTLREINHSLESRVIERTEAVQAAERRLREIANSIPGTVFQLQKLRDGRYRYNYLSEGAEALLGVPSERLVADFGQALALLAPEDQARLSSRLKEASASKEGFELEYRIRSARHPDGLWLRTSASFIHDQAGEAVWNGYHIDITATKHLEAELGAAKSDADAANVAKSRFLAMMSHELRTPLNAVIGLGNLTLQTELDAQQRDWVAKMHRASKNQLRLINELLDLSKLEAGKMQLEALPFELKTLVDLSIEMVTEQAREKGLPLKVELEPGLPRMLVGDAMRLGQVLMNLLSNAVKFTAKGEVALRVNRKAATPEGLELEFAVSDTGIGISEQARANLFSAFNQADASTSRRYGGTGLGLAICREILVLMGSTMVLSSQPGLGSCFSFSVVLGFAGRAALELDTHNNLQPALGATSQSAPPAASGIPQLQPDARSELVAKISQLSQQLQAADGDALDGWLLLLKRFPWLGEIQLGQQAAKALSAYQFQTARRAIDLLVQNLP